MYSLFVSFDAGCSYQKFRDSENLEELLQRTEKREDSTNISWCRWYIEKDGELVEDIVCPIHKHIVETLYLLDSGKEGGR